ncbi:hypothetical protein GQ42DRAFT_28569 [Ramicandelaber brevisporus]|nr:hypothetical protein GQ42DRAFT_28569 [Ramicandelaber brevisporus]
MQLCSRRPNSSEIHTQIKERVKDKERAAIGYWPLCPCTFEVSSLHSLIFSSNTSSNSSNTHILSLKHTFLYSHNDVLASRLHPVSRASSTRTVLNINAQSRCNSFAFLLGAVPSVQADLFYHILLQEVHQCTWSTYESMYCRNGASGSNYVGGVGLD